LSLFVQLHDAVPEARYKITELMAVIGSHCMKMNKHTSIVIAEYAKGTLYSYVLRGSSEDDNVASSVKYFDQIYIMQLTHQWAH